MRTPTQLALLAEEPESTPASASPLKPMSRSLTRVLMPKRNHLELRAIDLDSLLPEGHRARLVWAYVMQADLGPIYAGIKAVEGGSGRPAIAPDILFALWLYATLEGVGSARAIARLTAQPRRLSVAVRRGAGQPSHPVRFPGRPRGHPGWAADCQRGGAVGGQGGQAQAGGAGRDAGSCQCRSRLVPAPRHPGAAPGRCPEPSPNPQTADRRRPRRVEPETTGGENPRRP